MSDSKKKLMTVPVNKIRENANSLRPVDKENEQYQNLAKSIAHRGILKPLLLREFPNPEDENEMLYGLIDGLQRFNGALDAGLKEVPAYITEMNQAEIEEAQIVANLLNVETKPAEYSNHLNNMLKRRPTLTLAQLASTLDCSESWLKQRLKLVKLPENIQSLVDENRIILTNACALADLPDEDRIAMLDRAMTEKSEQFVPSVNERLAEIRKARSQGKKAGPIEFKPTPRQRAWGEVKKEYESPSVGNTIITQQNITTAKAAWEACIAWLCTMDPESQKQQVEAHNKRVEAQKKAAADKKAERDKMKQQEAARVQAALQAEQAELAKTGGFKLAEGDKHHTPQSEQVPEPAGA